MTKRYTYILATIALFNINCAFAQILEPVKWQFGSKKINLKEAVVFIKATIENGWHLYSQHVEDSGPQATTFTFNPSGDFKLIGNTAEPKAKTVFEPVFNMNVPYFDSEVVFQQRVKVISGQPTIKGTIVYQVCNDERCIPGEKDFVVRVN